MRKQILLAPAQQGRNQQAGQREIVKRLRGKAQGGHEVLHCQRIAEAQPVDPGHRDTVAVQPRDDERSEVAPFLDQHHDIACAGAALGPARQRKAIAGRVEPFGHLPRDPVGQQAVVPRQPAFALTAVVFFLGDTNDLPQTHQSGFATARVRIAALIEPEPLMADRIDRPIHETEHLLVGAIAPAEAVFLQSANIGRAARIAGRIGGGIHLVAEEIARLPEVFRAGPLEAEDRLLVIAHGKDRAHRLAARARTVEIIVGQCLHDRPLRRVGILRFIDEDVIEAAVELVTDPVGHRAVGQERGGAGDEIVEIDQPFAFLRPVPGKREGASRFELRAEECRQFEQCRAFAHLGHGFGHPFLVARKVRIDFFRPGHLARGAIGLEQCPGKPVDRGKPGLRIARQPAFEKIGAGLARLCRPAAAGGQAGAQAGAGKRRVRTCVCNPCGIGIGGEAQQAKHARLHRRLPAARPLPQVHVPRAAHQPAADRIGSLALAHLGDRPGDARVAFGQQVRENIAAQEVALAVFHWTRSGQHARFAGEGGKQILGEGVDRIDPQSAAGAIEDAGEQRPGSRARFWVAGRAQKRQFARQLRIVHPDPARQYRVDTHCHFSRARLGESEAQDLRRIGTRFEQQPQHTRRQDLRLAGPRAGRKPHAVLRIDREALLVLQFVDGPAHAVSPPSWCAIHSSSRIS